MKQLQYDRMGKKFTDVAKSDPSKLYAQYPSLLRYSGDVKGKTILDVGCGDGTSSRIFADKGGRVVGYDISKEQISQARKIERASCQGIIYSVGDPYTFSYKPKFDLAVSLMVLPYAPDRKYLDKFFESTYALLKKDSSFVSLISNPEFKTFNKVMYNRMWTENKNGTVRVHFYKNDSENITSADFGARFSRKDYENAAKSAGFKTIIWKKIIVEKKGIDTLGKDYWKDFMKDCPYKVFIARKK